MSDQPTSQQSAQQAYADAFVGTLKQQRNEALDALAALNGQCAQLRAENDSLRGELSALASQLHELQAGKPVRAEQ
jgi:predicted  nucleic acid-binding Zn-ribbon protein